MTLSEPDGANNVRSASSGQVAKTRKAIAERRWMIRNLTVGSVGCKYALRFDDARAAAEEHIERSAKNISKIREESEDGDGRADRAVAMWENDIAVCREILAMSAMTFSRDSRAIRQSLALSAMEGRLDSGAFSSEIESLAALDKAEKLAGEAEHHALTGRMTPEARAKILAAVADLHLRKSKVHADLNSVRQSATVARADLARKFLKDASRMTLNRQVKEQFAYVMALAARALLTDDGTPAGDEYDAMENDGDDPMSEALDLAMAEIAMNIDDSSRKAFSGEIEAAIEFSRRDGFENIGRLEKIISELARRDGIESLGSLEKIVSELADAQDPAALAELLPADG